MILYMYPRNEMCGVLLTTAGKMRDRYMQMQMYTSPAVLLPQGGEVLEVV